MNNKKLYSGKKTEITWGDRYIFAFVILCCIPFLSPQGLTYTNYAWVLTLFNQTQKIVSVILMLLYIKDFLRKKIKIDVLDVAVFLLCFLQLFCTWYANLSLSNAASRTYMLLGTYLIIRMLLRKNPIIGLRALFTCFLCAFITSTVVIVLLYRAGGIASLGDIWLFGQKNTLRNIIFPVITLSAIIDRLNNKKISILTFVLFLIGIISLWMVNSSTSLAVGVAFIGLFLFLYIFDLDLIPFSLMVIIYIILEIIIVFVRKVDIFAGFITNILQRDISFTGRMHTWDIAMFEIAKSPTFGIGVFSLGESPLIHSRTYVNSHAHNALLDITLKCGVVGLIVMVLIVYLCCRGIYKMKTNTLASIFGISVGMFIITGLMGELWNFGFFVILFLASMLARFDSYISDANIKKVRKKHIKIKF